MKAKLRLWLTASVQLASVLTLGAIAEFSAPTAVRAEPQLATEAAEPKPDLFDLLAEIKARANAPIESNAPLESLAPAESVDVADSPAAAPATAPRAARPAPQPIPNAKPDLFDLLADIEARRAGGEAEPASQTESAPASPTAESVATEPPTDTATAAVPPPAEPATETKPDLFEMLAEIEARRARQAEAAEAATASGDTADDAEADREPEASSEVALDPVEPASTPPTASPAEVPAASESASPAGQVPADVTELSSIAPTDVRILSPGDGSTLDLPAASIVLQFAVGAQIDLRVNGVSVNPNLIGRTETDTSTDIVLQTWYGVVFEPGFNTLTAQATYGGEAGPVQSYVVKVAGGAESIRLDPVEARIPADGRTVATIKGELLDANNLRSRYDATVTLNTSAGEFVGADIKPGQPGFQVRAFNGQFEAKLRSTNRANIARIQAITTGLETFTQLEFSTYLRPSIATGVLDFRLGNSGTNFYRSFRDFLPPDGDNGTQLDFYGAGFATGPIGEWLFTGAVNSDRTLNSDGDGTSRLTRRFQSTEQTYPVYGDSSSTENTAPSKDSLYLRLERAPSVFGAPADFLMWGDYDTDEFSLSSQKFTSVGRNLHGFKTNFTFGNFQLTGIFSDDTDGFQRDTIAPDGTSGFYFLSQQLIVPGSEQITLELEELLRPGTVVKRVELTRGIDYDINYDRGSLLFRQPLLRTEVARNIDGVDDGTVLARRIVTTYQFESDGENVSIYGGRVLYHFSRDIERESWLGATYFKENQGSREFELYGADARIPIGKDGELVAEYAHSTNDSTLVGEVSGSAYRVELDSQLSDTVNGRAYWRTADPGFSNNATTSFVPGQTRYGAEIQADFSRDTSARIRYDREINFGTAPLALTTLIDQLGVGDTPLPGRKVDNSLTTFTVGIEQRFGKANLQVDYIYRDRSDRLAAQPLDSSSSQLRSRLEAPLNDRLTLYAQNEVNLSSSEDVVYPDRTQIGLEWEVAEDLFLGVAQNWVSSGQFGGQSFTTIDISGDHEFDRNSSLSGRYGIVSGIDGVQGQGAMGLNHKWELSPGLFADVSYERVVGGLVGLTGAGTQFPTPFLGGQNASAVGVSGGESYSIGLEYTDNPDLKASVRFEERVSSTGSNTVISGNVDGKLSPSLTGLLRYQQANSSSQNLDRLGDTVDLRLGLAYRNPENDKFNALLRYEYRKNPSVIPETLLLGRGTGSEEHVFAFEAIYAPNWRWELYGKYAFRSSTSFLANSFVNHSSVSLGQLRATYRLGFNWDVLAEVRWINQPSAGYSETGFVTELGYYLNPNLRFAVGYSTGNVSDRDFSGSRNGNGLYVGMTVKVNEIFNGFGLQKVAPAQQTEATLAGTPDAETAQPTRSTDAATSPALSSRRRALEDDPTAIFVPKIDMSALAASDTAAASAEEVQ